MCSRLNIKMIDVTERNIEQILALALHEDQLGYVDSLTSCIKLSNMDPRYIMKGLYYGDQLVGFTMFGCFEDEAHQARVWLNEFLIDKNYQGLGLGSKMLSVVIECMLKTFQTDKIYLSVVQSNDRAVHLYKKFGFHITEEVVEAGEYVMKYETNHHPLPLSLPVHESERLVC